MAGPYTTLANLLEGVGEFPKVPENLLRSLLPAEDRAKGLSDGLAHYHTIAWKRCIADFEMDRIDIDDQTLSDEVTELVQAMCCHLIMSILHKQNRTHPQDSHNMAQKDHFDEYDRIRGRLRVVMASGRTTELGEQNRLIRA